MTGKREYGDYQTPRDFAIKVCRFLKEKCDVRPSTILEPTCGIGNFIEAATMFDAQEITGVEIQKQYCEICQSRLDDSRINIINADIFCFDIRTLIKDKENVLVIGNPPWATNATLSKIDSSNIPKKRNFKGLKGLDAVTGASNFDICEYIILKLIESLSGTRATIAMLCKTSVARNVFLEMKRSYIKFKKCAIFEFNAGKVFGINAKACLFIIELDNEVNSPNCLDVYSFDDPDKIVSRVIYKGGSLCNQAVEEGFDFSGKCCFEWRQGVKHDCSKIMELKRKEEKYVNGLGEIVDIEREYIYPLIKSSMFKSAIINDSDKYVIVTQRRIGEDTTIIRDTAPKTWKYLEKHLVFFEKRKSSIYMNAPAFSMFGIGEYSYSPYKVGVSGFYKKPFFSLLESKNGSPIMTDDTSYFICLPTFETAYTAMLILNSEYVQNFLCSIAFLDAKRPFTKKVLEKIDFSKVLNVVKMADLKKTEKRLGLECRIDEDMVEQFKSLSMSGQIQIPLYVG